MTDPIEQEDDDGLDPEDRDGLAVDDDDPIAPVPASEAQEGHVEQEDE